MLKKNRQTLGKQKRDYNYSVTHTIERLKERYNLEITPLDYKELCQLVSAGVIIAEEPDMKQQIIDVLWEDQKIRVVWDYENNRIRTVIKND